MGDLCVEQRQQIELLQDNLGTFRRLAGWSMEQLADRIGFSKQTASNLENKKTEMTLTQYIAIRAVLDYETQINEDNIALKCAISVLLNENRKYSPEEQKSCAAILAVAAAALAGGATPAMVLTYQIISQVFPAGGDLMVVPMLATWMSKVIPQGKEKKKGGKRNVEKLKDR